MMRTQVLVFILMLLPLQLSAQGAETILRVQEHFERGASHFAAEEYDRAIREFEAGNGLIPNPIFLYNISLAHGKLGRIEQSLAVASLADAQGLDEPDASQNRARIMGLHMALRARAAASAMEAVEKVEQPPNPPLLSYVGWIGVGASSLGVVGLVSALFVDIGIGPEIENYKEAAAANDTTTYRALKAEIESDQAIARALFFMGLGLGAIGAGLIVYDLYFDEDGPVSEVSLILGPQPSVQISW